MTGIHVHIVEESMNDNKELKTHEPDILRRENAELKMEKKCLCKILDRASKEQYRKWRQENAQLSIEATKARSEKEISSMEKNTLLSERNALTQLKLKLIESCH